MRLGLKLWYNATEFFIAWDKYIEASDKYEGSELFAYDLVDITRNSLQIVAIQYYTLIMDGYNNKNTTSIINGGEKLADLLEDMDDLLASNDRFLVGKWIADARSWGTDTNETDLYEYNARMQVTLWGPDGEIVDYASKQWAGVMKDYYKPRFEFFANWLQQLILNGTSWDSYIFNEKIMATVETPWTQAHYSYPTKPVGNSIKIAKALHAKYRPDTHNAFWTYLEDEMLEKSAIITEHNDLIEGVMKYR